jgi:hypothetical protein
MEMSSTDRARLRIEQIVTRLITKHPKAARDPELASMLGDLEAIIDSEVIDKPDPDLVPSPTQPGVYHRKSDLA